MINFSFRKFMSEWKAAIVFPLQSQRYLLLKRKFTIILTSLHSILDMEPFLNQPKRLRFRLVSRLAYRMLSFWAFLTWKLVYFRHVTGFFFHLLCFQLLPWFFYCTVFIIKWFFEAVIVSLSNCWLRLFYHDLQT